MTIETGSSLQTFATCPKLYEFKYVKLLETRGYSSALSLGSLVHAFIEQFSGVGDQLAVGTVFNHISERIDKELRPQLKLDLHRANGMADAWRQYWGGQHPFGNDKWEWIASEKEFTFAANKDRDLHAGKIDGILRNKEWDKVFVYELKTAAAREKESYVHRLGVDRQVSANIYAAQEMGYHVDGILYDIIWKPMIRQKKEETEQELADRFIATMVVAPEEHFQREVIYRKDEDIKDHLYDVQAQFLAIDNAHKQGRFYRNSGACDKYGTLCSFFSACFESGNPDMESVYRKRDRKHAELSKEIQDEEPQ